jgi:mono/diheme cytochrome c family protein
VKPFFFILIGAMVFGAAVTTGLAVPADTPASSGVYTAAQAARGADVYTAKCASCHGDDLSGTGTAPALAGGDFLTLWTAQPMAALFDKIQTSMPSDQPGTLIPQQTADLIAFFLRSNKYPVGQTELPADKDHLKQIMFDNPPGN